MSSVIFVSLRMAASAVAPSAPMPLRKRLRARGAMGNGERVGVSMGADTRASGGGGGALERGHGAALEPLAQLGDALSGVGAVAPEVEAAELVEAQAANELEVVSVGADTKANTLGQRRTSGWRSSSP